MSFSSSNMILTLASILFIPQILAADPLYHICSTSQNFTANSPYQTNLNKLTAALYIQTYPSGFGSTTLGQPPQTAHGIALCRGDVSTGDCRTCVAEACGEIRKRCPYNKAAIIWYDHCFLKYSDEAFFGQIDSKNKVYMWNVGVVNNTALFNEKTQELLTQLAQRAYGGPRLYGTGELQLDGSKRLYGMVQCSRDLNGDGCKKCLEGLIGEIKGCCDGKEGGRVIGGSCSFRYEVSPFLNSS